MSTFGPEMCDLSAGRTYTVPAWAAHFGAAQINGARQRHLGSVRSINNAPPFFSSNVLRCAKAKKRKKQATNRNVSFAHYRDSPLSAPKKSL